MKVLDHINPDHYLGFIELLRMGATFYIAKKIANEIEAFCKENPTKNINYFIKLIPKIIYLHHLISIKTFDDPSI